MALYRNVMETIVEEKLERMLDNLDCCKCEQCRADIMAFALNKLPPKYVVTPQGEAYSKTFALGIQHDMDVMTALAQAASLVRGHPRH